MFKKEDKSLIFEQYKIAVEMADKISSRREWANKIFLSANSVIFAFLATKNDFNDIHILISLFWILLSLTWWWIIQNYRNLNSAKYKVINEIEEKLPIKIYKSEWELLHNWKDKKIYSSLTNLEKKLPFLFVVFYIVLFFYVFVYIYWNVIIKMFCA